MQRAVRNARSGVRDLSRGDERIAVPADQQASEPQDTAHDVDAAQVCGGHAAHAEADEGQRTDPFGVPGGQTHADEPTDRDADLVAALQVELVEQGERVVVEALGATHLHGGLRAPSPLSPWPRWS